MKTTNTSKIPAAPIANVIAKPRRVRKDKGIPAAPPLHSADKPKRVRKPTAKQVEAALADQGDFGLVVTPEAGVKKIVKPDIKTGTLTKDQLRILARDLDDGPMALFKQWIDVNGVMGGSSVDLTDLVPVPKSSIKKDMVHLADLKKKLLVHTVLDNGVEWVHLTPVGEQLQAHLYEVANPAPLVVDGLAAHINATTSVKPTAAAKPVATKRVPATKFNRAAMRYEAITRTMAAVKMDSWGKGHYKPTIKALETDFPLLYSKLKTPEKIAAYSVGILDFCLAACRKLNTRP